MKKNDLIKDFLELNRDQKISDCVKDINTLLDLQKKIIEEKYKNKKMNLMQKIFGHKKDKVPPKNLEETLKIGKFSEEEILRFKIIRIEILLNKAKLELKEFLKPKKKK